MKEVAKWIIVCLPLPASGDLSLRSNCPDVALSLSPQELKKATETLKNFMTDPSTTTLLVTSVGGEGQTE